MTEHYTKRRNRKRNAQIIRAHEQGDNVITIAAMFDLSKRQVQRIIKPLSETTKETHEH